MLRRINGLLLVCGIIPSMAAVGVEPPQLTELQKGMPPVIAGLIARIVYCNHWQGEEPYDSERAKEIRGAVSKLRCASLGADEAAALKRYGQKPNVRSAIARAKDIYL